MSSQNFQYALIQLLKDEGGYTNNPADPGGPTNFGITLVDYRKYINSAGTADDVRKMNISDAKAIYKAKYWNLMDCDNLPSGVDYCVLDYAVNSGPGRPRAVLNANKGVTDPVKLINIMCDERMAFLRRLVTFPTFGRGWTRRVTGVRANSIKLAQGKTGAPAGTAGGAVVAGGGALAATPHNYWPWIIGATMVAIVIGYIGVAYYEWTKSDAYAALHKVN